MREAESALALKEMRQRLAELEQHWAVCYIQIQRDSYFQKYIHTRAFDPLASIEKDAAAAEPPTTPSNPSPPLTARARLAKITASFMGSVSEHDDGITVKELEDQLMGVRIKEADTLAELKEMRQKVMELETQNHVCTNQLKRQDEEMRRVREELDVTQKVSRGRRPSDGTVFRPRRRSSRMPARRSRSGFRRSRSSMSSVSWRGSSTRKPCKTTTTCANKWPSWS